MIEPIPVWAVRGHREPRNTCEPSCVPPHPRVEVQYWLPTRRGRAWRGQTQSEGRVLIINAHVAVDMALHARATAEVAC